MPFKDFWGPVLSLQDQSAEDIRPRVLVVPSPAGYRSESHVCAKGKIMRASPVAAAMPYLADRRIFAGLIKQMQGEKI
jgi:hypothetical protein